MVSQEIWCRHLKHPVSLHRAFPAWVTGRNTVEGYVVSYPAVGTITNRGATVVNAEVRIDNPPDEILPNYSFTGEIEITAPVTLLIVERQAIGYRGGQAYAEIIQKDGTTKEVPVKVAQYTSSYVNVLEGLTACDQLKNQSTSTGSL